MLLVQIKFDTCLKQRKVWLRPNCSEQLKKFFSTLECYFAFCTRLNTFSYSGQHLSKRCLL